ncbi:hypothetical protein [Streptomyces sp. NPDC007063]|uniref:hypothetical protein n=1 Tax=Streptomyces sp. NPDC007063 TaxID=3364772 RepID=UPI00367F8149
MQRWVSVLLSCAGVWVLAGPGWSLLLAGVAVWGLAPRQQQPAAWSEAAAKARQKLAAVTATPRRAVAVGTMASGAVALPTGVLLAAGAGAGVISLGVVLGGVSLLTGWNA